MAIPTQTTIFMIFIIFGFISASVTAFYSR